MNDSSASRWFWGEACQLYTKCPLSFQDLLFLLWGEFNLPILVNVNKTNWNREATISETRCGLGWYFVHVCHDSCSVCGRNRLRCCRSWPIAQHLYIPSPEGMKLPLTTTMAPRFATIDTQVKPESHPNAVQVADPYKWMEDPDSSETAEFVTQQNAVSQPYINSCQVCVGWKNISSMKSSGEGGDQERTDWPVELWKVWLPSQGGGQVLLLQELRPAEPVGGVRAGLLAGGAQSSSGPQHLLGWWHCQPHKVNNGCHWELQP